MSLNIQILGSDCPKCKALYTNTCEAIDLYKIDATVELVKDITKILQFNLRVVPALVVNAVVLVKGNVPDVPSLGNLLLTYIQENQ